MRSPLFTSVYRILGRYWLKPEYMTNEAVDVVTNPDNLGFEDLGVKPIAFGQKAHEYVQDLYWQYNAHHETNRDANNA